MLVMEASSPHPLRRICRPLNKPKLAALVVQEKNSFFYYDRSRNVHENIRSAGILWGENPKTLRKFHFNLHPPSTSPPPVAI